MNHTGLIQDPIGHSTGEGVPAIHRRNGTRPEGLLLIVAAALFWLSWALMPGVGVTDAHRILALVGSQRSSVLLSVIAQLASAAIYVPALLGIASSGTPASARSIRWGAGILMLGAMGSAVDTIFHLLAYAMTAPGLGGDSLVKVMTFVQGPGLLLVAPLIASFFVGGPWLSWALARRRTISQVSFYLHALAFGVLLIGAVTAQAGVAAPRTVGLTFLGAISLAQAWAGAGIARSLR